MYKRILSILLVTCLIGVTAPVKAKAESAAPMMAANSQVLVLQSDGRIFGWGDNSYGQLGIGDQNVLKGTTSVPGSTLSAVHDPVEVTYFQRAKLVPTRIFCAQNTSYVVVADGSIYAAGDNSKGQCGANNATATYKTWVKMQTAGNVIKAGRIWVKYDTMYVENLTDNNLYVCGSGDNSKTGALLQGDLRRLYPLGIPTGGLADVEMSRTSTHLLFNSGAKYVANLKYVNASGGIGTGTGCVGPGQYLVTGYLGTQALLMGSKYFSWSLAPSLSSQLRYPDDLTKTIVYSTTAQPHQGGSFFPNVYSGGVVSDFRAPLYNNSNINVRYDSEDSYYWADYFSTPNPTTYTKYPDQDIVYMASNMRLLSDMWGGISGNGGRSTEDIALNKDLSENPRSDVFLIGTDYDGRVRINEDAFGHWKYNGNFRTPMKLSPWFLGSKPQWAADRMAYFKNEKMYFVGMSNAKGQNGGNLDLARFLPVENVSLTTMRTSLGNPQIQNFHLAGATNYVIYNDSSKTVVSQGDNAFGQLGIGSTAASNATATKIAGLTGKGVTSIFATDGVAVALCGNGDIYAWGNNAMGTCGQGYSSAAKYNTPQLVKNFAFLPGASAPPTPGTISVPTGVAIGAGHTLTWGASTGAIKYQVDLSNDNGATWGLLNYTDTNTYYTTRPAAGSYLYRVAAVNKYNLMSQYRNSATVKCIAIPAKPTNVTVSPSYVLPNEPITVSWSVPTGGTVVVWRIADGVKTQVYVGAATKYTENANSTWLDVSYTVNHRFDTSVDLWSGAVTSNSVKVAQNLIPPKYITGPTSVVSTDPVALTWDRPNVRGDFTYNVYRSVVTSANETEDNWQMIMAGLETEGFETTADKLWKNAKFAVTVTDGNRESDKVVSTPISVTDYVDPNAGGSGGGLNPEDLAALMGALGTNKNGVLNPDDDGISISTLQKIEKIKTYTYTKTGVLVKEKEKTYESLAGKNGVAGYIAGLNLPVTYKSSKQRLYVSGYLDFGGTRYPVKWGDYTGPDYVQNLSGETHGYVFIPVTAMGTNGKVNCTLYVQDSEEASNLGKVRMSYMEKFQVDVKMS